MGDCRRSIEQGPPLAERARFRRIIDEASKAPFNVWPLKHKYDCLLAEEHAVALYSSETKCERWSFGNDLFGALTRARPKLGDNGETLAHTPRLLMPRKPSDDGAQELLGDR